MLNRLSNHAARKTGSGSLLFASVQPSIPGSKDIEAGDMAGRSVTVYFDPELQV